MIFKYYLIIFIICSQKHMYPCVRNIHSLEIYVTRIYPYTTEGDIRHKQHNWRVVQIVNTINTPIVNSFESNIKENGYINLTLLVMYWKRK